MAVLWECQSCLYLKAYLSPVELARTPGLLGSTTALPPRMPALLWEPMFLLSPESDLWLCYIFG